MTESLGGPARSTQPCSRNAVLITRPLGQAAALADRIRACSLEPVIAPVMQLRSFTPNLPAGVQAVLATSGNALDAVRGWPVRLLAVGDATASRARQAGFADVISAQGDAAALVALADATLDPSAGPVLLLSGAGQGQALAAALRARGYRVLRRVTYAAGPVPRFPQAAADALARDALHAAIFLSGETAATFARLVPPGATAKLAGVLALAIGKPAADALKPLPWRQVLTAATPTLDGVLALL